MDPITQELTKGAAGVSSEYVAVDDLFQNTLYNGDGQNSRDIPLARIDPTDGNALVWVKSLGSSHNHFLTDNVRGMTRTVITNGTGNQQSISDGIKAFNSNSYTVGSNAAVNSSIGYRYIGQVFKEHEHFFDIVEYTGNGDPNGKVVSHNLGSKPGFMMIKNMSQSNTEWAVWHHTQFDKYANFQTGGFANSSSYWANTDPNSSTFKVGTADEVNASGNQYIAYLFGHDQAVFGPNNDETIIKCGSYTGSGSAEQLINVGWEPQWLLVKRTTSGEHWSIFHGVDGWRGAGEGDSSRIFVNNNGAQSAVGRCHIDARGFRFINESTSAVNGSGQNYIYVAIRRSQRIFDTPTDVFEDDYRRGWSAPRPRFEGCNPEPDFVIYRENQNSTYFQMSNRHLQSGRYIPINNDSGRQTDSGRYEWRKQGGFGTTANSDTTRLAWMFKRARKFCDVVHYYGNGSSNAIYHGLGAEPKLVFVLPSTPTPISVYNFHSGSGSYMYLKDGTADTPQSSSSHWNTTAPSSDILYLGSSSDVNANNSPYHAYLFGDCPGISKIGTYNGSIDTVTVDCGFQPRVVMIKNLSNSDSWWWCNTLLGISSPGNDTALQLGSTANSYSGYDIVNLTATGFTTPSTVRDWNQNGNTYLFWAIA